MKKIIQLLYMILPVVVLTACGDDDRGEVISQDLSYQLDANYVYVDIPEEFQFDPSNILYLNGKTVLKLNGKNDGEHTTIVEGTEFTFNVGLKKALDKDILVRLIQDPTLLEKYTSAGDLKQFPEESFTLSNVKLEAGVKEGKATLTFRNLDVLNEMPGYILPLRLEFIDAADGVKISSENYSVFVELKVKLAKDNIDPSNNPVEGILFNNNVTFESSKTSGLGNLYDGNLNSSWYPADASTYLSMSFSSPTKILGIKIDVKKGTYLLGKLNVYADEGNGFMSYGAVDRNVGDSHLYIKFKNPVDVYTIKFDGMLTVNGGTGPDIYEINFIK